MRSFLAGIATLVLVGSATAQAPAVSPCESVALRCDEVPWLAARVAELPARPRYELRLDLDSERGTFALREEIDFVHDETRPLRDVALFVYANRAGARRADGRAAVRIVSAACGGARRCAARELEGGLLRVRFEHPVLRGERVELTIQLEGELPRLADERTSFDGQMMESLSSLLGSHESGDFGLLAQANGVVSLGGFYAVLAPRREGAWQVSPELPLGDLTSDDLADIGARVRVPAGVTILTPGVTTDVGDNEDGSREFVIEAPLVRDFAVLASEHFQSSDARAGDVLVRVSLLPGAMQRADQVLATAKQALELYEQAFGAYPYRELDVVEAPLVGGVGGVEFSGLVTIAHMLLMPSHPQGLSALLSQLSGKLGSQMEALMPRPEEMLDLVVAHEVAHQWWHVLVGSDSRRNPFVDEGLAQWSALYFLERARSSQVAARAEKQLATSYQVMRMLGQPDRPVNRAVGSFETQVAYGGLVYGKGPLVYRELRRVVGDPAFFEAVSGYVQRYAFQAAPRNGLTDLLAKGPEGRRVEALAHRWLEETHGDDDLGTFALGGFLGGAGRGLDPGALDLGALLRGGGSKDLQGAMRMLEQLLRRPPP